MSTVRAAGLPGPVVAELLAPGFQCNELAAVKSPVYLEEDAALAQVASLMLAYGIRWRFVKLAIATMPDHDLAELWRIRDFWAQRAPAPAWRASQTAAVAVLVGLLAGVFVGLSLAGLRP